ncbi:MAG: ArsR family transcriptional regulator [Thermoplasmata archaeon]|jgi:putative transcriptional regulator
MIVRSDITKLIILSELLKGNKKTSSIAKRAEVTIQAISEYLKNLKKSGLIDENLNVTNLGIEYAMNVLENLRTFTTSLYNTLKFDFVVEVIAGEDVKKGDNIGIFMEDGKMVGYKKESSYNGFAINDALKGEDLGILSPNGILNYKLGELKIIILPSIKNGGSRVVNYELLRDSVQNCKVGIFGSVAEVVAKKAGIKIDFDCGSVRASMEACHRGLNSAILVSKDLFNYVIDEIETPQIGISKIDYRILDFSNSHI